MSRYVCSITRREMILLQHVAAGEGNKTIARCLGISPETVHATLGNLYRKLGVHNRTHAVIVAMQRGLFGGQQ